MNRISIHPAIVITLDRTRQLQPPPPPRLHPQPTQPHLHRQPHRCDPHLSPSPQRQKPNLHPQRRRNPLHPRPDSPPRPIPQHTNHPPPHSASITPIFRQHHRQISSDRSTPRLPHRQQCQDNHDSQLATTIHSRTRASSHRKVVLKSSDQVTFYLHPTRKQ